MVLLSPVADVIKVSLVDALASDSGAGWPKPVSDRHRRNNGIFFVMSGFPREVNLETGFQSNDINISIRFQYEPGKKGRGFPRPWQAFLLELGLILRVWWLSGSAREHPPPV